MILRTIKLLLVFGIAIFYSLVVFNNLTDYASNYEFGRHVMMMDSTFPGNRGMWRAINTPLLHTAFYISIITWEIITTLLCWWGGFRMVKALRGTPAAFQYCQTSFHRRAGTQSADVAGRISGRRWRMVLDVAIENLERSRCCFSDVHGDWDCVAARRATGHSRPTLARRFQV